MIRKFYEADCMGSGGSPKFGGAEMPESKSAQSTQEGGTVEGEFNMAEVSLAAKNYASIVSATDKKRISELEAKVNELTMDNMTHEYNQAEAEKFAPEFEKQIREDEAEKWKKEVERLRSALINLLAGVDGLPPLTAIAGVLTAQCKDARKALNNNL